MSNIFSILTGNPRPAGPVATVQVPANKVPVQGIAGTGMSRVSTKDLIKAWQRDPKAEYTSELLKRMRPTMTAALNSYAPGMGDQLSVKAAKLTLHALKTYNPDYGTQPSTAVFNNLKRLNRLAAKSANIMQVPETRSLDMQRLQKASAKFEDDHDREPSDAELADLTGMSRARIASLRDNNSVIVSESSTLSTDSQQSTLSSNTLTDKDYFEYTYSSVDPINQKIMEWASGAHGKPRLKAVDIANRLHMSPAAVSQRMAKIQQTMSDARSLL